MNIDEIGSYLERDSNYKKLVSFAMKILPRESAEDAVQDALIKALANLDKFNPDKASFKTWLYHIVQNCCIDIHRKDSRSPLNFAVPIDDAFDFEAKQENPLEEVLGIERDGFIDEALGKLSGLRREALKDVYFKGVKLSSAPGSKHEGVKTKAIRCRIFQGQKQMRELLSGDGYDWS